MLSTVSHVLSNIYLANFLLVSLENQHIVILSIELCTQLMISENTGLLTKTKSTSWHYFLQASFSRKALWNGAHYSQKHFENEWVNILHHSEMLPKPQWCCREGCVMSRACLGGRGSSANQEYSSSFFFFLVLCKINKGQFEWVKIWMEPEVGLQLKCMHMEKRGQGPLQQSAYICQWVCSTLFKKTRVFKVFP